MSDRDLARRVAQWRSGPLTTVPDGGSTPSTVDFFTRHSELRVRHWKWGTGVSGSIPGSYRVVRVQVPRASLDGLTGVWCNGSMTASKTVRCGYESCHPCWID